MAIASETKNGFGEQYWDIHNLPEAAYKPSFFCTPLLDRIIVREIPIKEYYEHPEGVTVDLDNAHIKERSNRGEVMAVGDCVPMGGVILPMPVEVGQIVTYDETCMVNPIYENPAHRNRHDLPKYWEMRVADLNGILNA